MPQLSCCPTFLLVYTSTSVVNSVVPSVVWLLVHMTVCGPLPGFFMVLVGRWSLESRSSNQYTCIMYFAQFREVTVQSFSGWLTESSPHMHTITRQFSRSPTFLNSLWHLPVKTRRIFKSNACIQQRQPTNLKTSVMMQWIWQDIMSWHHFMHHMRLNGHNRQLFRSSLSFWGGYTNET